MTAAIVVLLVLGGPVCAQKPLSELIETEHFRIHYSQGDYFAADRVSRAAEESLKSISAGLEYKGAHPRIEVFVYPTHRDFVKATGTERGKFVLGRAHSGSEHIDIDSQELFAKVETVTAHEVAHIVVFRLLGPHADMPLWMHEGIAKTESHDWDDTDTHLLAEAISHGKLMRLKEISHTFPESREGLAYAQSASFLKYLIDTYGRAKLPLLLEETRRTGSFERAVPIVMGKELADLEEEWVAYLERKYAPYMWVRMISTGMIGLLPILVLLAYLVRRRAKRERMERYAQEEWEAANRRDWGNQWPGGGLQ